VSEPSFSQAGRTAVVAHRGSSATAPENTIEAFDAAIAAGADAVEFDVRLSADGVAFVMHDADVSRTTNGHGIIRGMTPIFGSMRATTRYRFPRWRKC
jgi:glycerophosphoryl diester phosphodiesterase